MQLICTVCGQTMQAKKSTKKYCSSACESQARKQRVVNSSLAKNCVICGTHFIVKTPAANTRQCCYNCMPEGVQLTRSSFAARIKEVRGGKCERCGYSTYTGALEFHHIDPASKDFTIGDANFRLKEAVEEVKKCILICSNCHRELHANLWQVKEIKGELL